MQEFRSFTGVVSEGSSFSDRVNALAQSIVDSIPPGVTDPVEIDLSTVESELSNIAERANLTNETLELLLRKAVARNLQLAETTGEEIDEVDIDLEMEGTP